MAKKTLLDDIIESIKGIDGRLINQSGTTKQMIADLNYKVVVPAKSAADSAASAADAAVASAQVTSDAMSAIASATAEAKQGANEAMSMSKSAWDVATGAKEAVTDFDPLLKSAQSDAKQANDTATSAYEQSRSAYDAVKADSSAVVAMQSSMADFREDVASAQSVADSANADASKALIQIADTASALSDAKVTFDSGVAEAKGLANIAQTTANNAVESAGENARALASQANALSDAKKAIDSDVASANGLANAAQSIANNAIKSASSVANDLVAVASQAKTNASGITKVTSDVGLLQTTVADNSGNISRIQETAAQIQQAVSDNSGAIVTATQTAQSATTVASDAKSNATVAVQTASGASVTAKNAQGDATTAITTAQSAVTQVSDAKSNATIAVQTASEASVTATNAQGDASIAKQTASDASIQIKNAQGDISALQTRAGKIEASVANNSGAIADVQVTANQLKASVSDNAGNITVAKQTADSAVTVASDAHSNATVAIQTASQASITASNASGQAASAVLTANGTMVTASDAKSDATVAVQTASGASLTATNAQNDATIAKQTASEATVQASNAQSDFAQLSIRANKIEANVANNSGAIASVQQTANGLTTTVGNVDNRVKTIEDKTNWTTKTGSLDMNTLTTTQNIYYRDTNLQNADGEVGWAYIQVVSAGERVTQTVWHDRSSIQHTRTGAVSGSSYNWDAWNKTATYAQVTEVKQTVNGLSTLVDDPKTGMTATYQTASQASLTAQNASGQAVTAVTTAQGAVTTAKNAQSDAVVAKQTASEASVTASNAAGDASVAKQTASQASISIKNAQSDITSLDVRADSLEAFQKDTNGNINKLVSRADGVDQTLTNQNGDITSLQSRAGKLESSMSTANGQISTLQQTANGLTTTVADIKANGGGVNLANGTKSEDQSVGNASQTTGWQIATIATFDNPQAGQQYTISVNTKPNGGSWKIQIWDGTSPTQRVKEVFGEPPAVAQEQKHTVTITWPSGSNKYLIVQLVNGNDGGQITWNSAMIEEGAVAHNWSPSHDDLQNQFTQIKTTVNGINTTINDPKIGLNAAYQTAAGNATTISNVKGDVAQLQTTANGLTSRVGSLESKTNTQQTAIDQNKAAIALKADQTTVDTLKGTVNKNTATLQTQANQIQAKVSASDVSGMLTGYATQSYAQSLVTQKANQWNLNITRLQTDVNAIKTTGGGVNLANGTKSDDQSVGNASQTTGWQAPTIATFNNPQAGQQYTISVNAKPNGGSWKIQIWDGTSPTQRVKWLCSESTNATQDQKHVLTFTWPSGSNKYLIVQLSNGNDGGQITWNSAMLEEGSVAHTWSPAPSDMATVTSVTNLLATVDGIQAQVYNSDGSSRITQLSNLIQSKVGTDDFNNLKQAVGLQTLDSADINNMKNNGHFFVHNLANNPIGGWVYVDVTGNGSSRIRQDVYRDNGNQHKYRRWVDNHWLDWEEGATYSEINQLKDAINLRVTKGDLISQINLEAGAALIQSNKIVLDAGTTVFTGDAFIPDAAISEINTDKLFFSDSNGNKSFMSTNLGSLDPMAPANTLSIRYNTGYEVTTSDRGVFFMMGQDYTRYAVRSKYSDKFSGIWAKDDEAFFIEEGQGLHLWAPGEDQSAWALYNSNNVGIRSSLAAANAIDVGKVDDGYAYNTKMDTSPTAIAFYVNGWEWVAGYVEAMGTTQHSTLSSKTRIEQADPEHMLDLINQTELTTFAYKSELADGTDHRHIGPIIDDINDVAQYQIPSEFVAPTKTARDDGNIVGALIGAVQALTKRIKTLEEKTK